MGIAESMRSMVDDIVVSHDSRSKAIGSIVSDTQNILGSARKTMKNFAVDRKKMSAEQSRNLADFAKDLSKSTGDMINIFHTNRKKMSAEQAKGLADFVKGISKNVEKLRQNAKDMIKGFHKDRKQTGAEQARNLADFAGSLAGDVDSMLIGFGKDRSKMSKELKDKLGKAIKDIKVSVGETIKGARELVGEYSSDMAKAKDAWESMSSTLAKAKKSGVAPKIEVRKKVTTVKEAVKEKPKAEPKAVPKPKTPEGQILALLEEHPRGRTMVQMGEEMGVHFASLLNPMKKLLESGKVNKIDKKYRLV
ncbi:hypothetical protein KKC91_12165 [bacterium]|nr:hypothetical protein [bacterium]